MPAPLLTPEVFQSRFNTTAADVIARLLSNPQSVPYEQVQAVRNLTTMQDPTTQQSIAPFEHQAYARDIASSGPGGTIAAAVNPFIYAGGKALGLLHGRSGTDSLTQILAGLQGAGQGFTQWLQSKGARPMWADNPPQQPPTWITGVRG